MLEEREFARQKVERLPRPGDRPADHIHLEIARPQDRLGGLGHRQAAAERRDPCRQFPEGEGFDEVIVAPRRQPLDPVVEPAHRGQEDSGRGDLGRAQRLHQRQTVEIGQHPVHDEHVIGLRHRLAQRVPARAQVIDRVAFFGQAAGDEIGGGGIVFYDEDLHRRTM